MYSNYFQGLINRMCSNLGHVCYDSNEVVVGAANKFK